MFAFLQTIFCYYSAAGASPSAAGASGVSSVAGASTSGAASTAGASSVLAPFASSLFSKAEINLWIE
jgi:hypothetical protein